jgi:hypothetical protein
VDTADWVQLEGEFTPTEAYTNLTLGAFQQGTEIDSVFLQHYDTWGGADLAIYFIDDVQLWPCQVGYNELGDDANAVQLFPNPAGDVLRLRTSTKGDLRLVVTDALGRECPVPPSVGSGASDGTFDLDVGSLAVGSYLLSITQGARMSVSKPFTIAR